MVTKPALERATTKLSVSPLSTAISAIVYSVGVGVVGVPATGSSSSSSSQETKVMLAHSAKATKEINLNFFIVIVFSIQGVKHQQQYFV